MTKALTKYQRNLPARGTTLVIGVILIALIIWLLLKNKQTPIIGNYSNKEEWSISYDNDGLPTRIVISRDARKS